MKKLLALFVALVIGATLFTPVTSQAAEYGGIGGRPARPQASNPRSQSIFIYTLRAGQSASDGVRVVNNTPETRTVKVYPTDAVLASGGTFSCAQAVEQPTGVGSWIKLDQSTVTLKPNSNQVIPFAVTTPEKASVGEHDGCIAIQDAAQTNKSSDESGVLLSFRSAIRVAVTIPGKIVKKLAITSVTTQPGDNNTITVTPTAKNSGNVSLDTTLDVSLTPTIGASSAHSSSTFPVLPDSSASWNLQAKQPFWGGWYHAVVKANYNSDPDSQLGTKGGQRTTITKSSGVIFVTPAPGALAIEIIVLLIIIGLIAWLVRRRLHRHHVDTRWTSYTVKKGDTISSVAKAHHVEWKHLARANKLRAPYHLESGNKLRVPPTSQE